MTKTHRVLLWAVGIVALLALTGYVVFKDDIDEWGAGIERISDWEEGYRADHPNATDAEVDAAFDAGIANITVWMEQYKQEHPGATDADAKTAFDAAWKK